MQYFFKILIFVWITLISGAAGQCQDKEKPLRVVSVAPAVTELIYALGKEDALVAVTEFCDYPPEAREKPKIGGIVDPNPEMILELAPDYIVYVPGLTSKLENISFASSKKVPVAYERIEEIFEAILTLGRILGAEKEAQDLKSRLLDDIKVIRETIPAGAGPKTLFVISRDEGMLNNIYAVGRKSYLHELLEIASAENIFGDIDRNYLHVSMESIIERDPEIIFDVRAMGQIEEKSKEKLTSEWRKLPVRAVASGRVYVLFGDEYVRPGPRMTDVLKKLASIIREHNEPPIE